MIAQNNISSLEIWLSASAAPRLIITFLGMIFLTITLSRNVIAYLKYELYNYTSSKDSDQPEHLPILISTNHCVLIEIGIERTRGEMEYIKLVWNTGNYRFIIWYNRSIVACIFITCILEKVAGNLPPQWGLLAPSLFVLNRELTFYFTRHRVTAVKAEESGLLHADVLCHEEPFQGLHNVHCPGLVQLNKPHEVIFNWATIACKPNHNWHLCPIGEVCALVSK